MHNFYLGNTGRAVFQLVLWGLGFLTIWLFFLGLIFWLPLWLWVFIEFILIIFRTGGYRTDGRGIPLQ